MESTAQPAAAGGSALRVLVVEDERDFARLIGTWLARSRLAAFAVDTAASLDDARRCLRTARYDVGLVDLGLPDSEGIETLRQLRSEAPRVPFVVCSAAADEGLLLASMRAGARDYLVKGPSVAQLLDGVLRRAAEAGRAAGERPATAATAETLLEDSEEKYRRLFATDSEPRLVVDVETGLIVEANDAAVVLYGHPLNELLRLRYADLAAGTEPDGNGKPPPPHVRLHRKRDGTVFPVEVSTCTFLLGGRRVLCTAVRDITARRRAERRAALSFARLRDFQAIVNRSPAVVVLCRCAPDWPIEFVSENAAQLGIEPGALASGSSGWLDLVHPDDAARVDADMHRRIGDGDDDFTCEFRMRTGNGAVRWAEARERVLRGGDGEARQIQGILLDITARRVAEQTLRASHAQLRALALRIESVREEERTRMSRAVHDELGHELMAVKMDIAALERRVHADGGIPEADLASGLAAIRGRADQTMQTVRRMAAELRPGLLDHLGAAAAIEWAAQDFARRSGTACRARVPEDDIPLTPARATGLYRVFQEILSNVARHSGATHVDVDLRVERERLTLDVRDNGVGIRREQVDHPLSLGILGMRERVRGMGGNFSIEGLAKGGTVVHVDMPVGPVPAAADEGGA